jgi:hypothetical protein
MGNKKVVIIEDWEVVLDDLGRERLIGVVINHPDFDVGERIYTKEIVRYIPSSLLIETTDTFYDLGNPKEVLT